MKPNILGKQDDEPAHIKWGPPNRYRGPKIRKKIPHKKIIVVLNILIAVIGFPSIAHEADVEKPYYPWDYGTIKAPIILETEITPPEREVQVVTGYGNGSCVPYARERTGILLYGRASGFLAKATSSGYTTGTSPVVGAMMITSEGPGHVAVVESVSSSTVRISEQNYIGLYVVGERTLEIDDPVIQGYIY